MKPKPTETAYDVGYAYGVACRGDHELGHEVDIEKKCTGSVDVPYGDYSYMQDRGIEPDPREYWRGFNAAIVEF